MNVGVLGLGLIGGSMARAYAKAGHTVYACENNEDIFTFSQLAGVVSGEMNQETIGYCQLIILAIYTEASVNWLQENAKYINKIFLRRYYPYQVQGFGAAPSQPAIKGSAPLIFYAVLVGELSPRVYYTTLFPFCQEYFCIKFVL